MPWIMWATAAVSVVLSLHVLEHLLLSKSLLSHFATCAAAAGPRKPSVAAKSRFGAAKKAGAKSGGGLGVKKMTTKVDDALFDQAPAEDPPPAAVLSISHTLSVRARAQCPYG